MNKNKIIEGIKNKSLYFKDLEEIYKNDKEVVLVAVQKYGHVLQFASKELKNDKEIVLSAVQQNVYALEYASQEIQDEIGENNPVKYLESYFLKQKLDEKLINNNKIVTRKIKI